MGAAKCGEVAIRERLHAERDAVDAGGAIAAKPLDLDAGRIGFKRDLDVGGNSPMTCHRFDHAGNRCGSHQRGRAAAEKDSRHDALRYTPSRSSNLGGKSADPSRLVDLFAADMAIEIAIRTFREAERPVDINAERLCVVAGVTRSGKRMISAGQGKPRPIS